MNEMSRRAPFQTFVFMDLEATGLIEDRPKVMEICLVAVNRFSMENVKQNAHNLPELPRVLDKLCICTNPNKLITDEAVRITKLSNENLTENQKVGFDRALVTLINMFLDRQTPPVCLVAHNGLKYDFPLLKTELLRLGASLNSTVYCMDSYQAMKELVTTVRYSLCELYKTFFGHYPEIAHSAEADVLTLILVCLCKAPKLLKWTELNSCSLREIQPMYMPSPRKPQNLQATSRARKSQKHL
ncbi:three prime repair exonuclease 2 [Latimeria chalumnae]|uniref:exodeoxyribonuclease III n=1 Tax=Latimeria chalumnae TaxID=7897 RepID=H2ZU14_LATCH|nr:PREDICTED: three prime repair exonuclease 2 [Latimeria chalumnae]|eukprot:XP_006014265.1 PREDICTED: three prime repair exonuclease 2 [Latimeria chalumnae]